MAWRYGDGGEKKLGNLEERYIRWVLGVDERILGYVVREELQRGKLKGLGKLKDMRIQVEFVGRKRE